MNYIGRFISNFKVAYRDINSATLTGAIDVVVVKQEDATFTSSPFHVRFGKIGVLRSKEKVVDIEINGEPADIHMKLGDNGEAFFVEPIVDGEEINDLLGTSPLPSFCYREDDIRSLDSGVDAEEITSKKFKDHVKYEEEEIEIATKSTQITSHNHLMRIDCSGGVDTKEGLDLGDVKFVVDPCEFGEVDEIGVSRVSKEKWFAVEGREIRDSATQTRENVDGAAVSDCEVDDKEMNLNISVDCREDASKDSTSLCDDMLQAGDDNLYDALIFERTSEGEHCEEENNESKHSFSSELKESTMKECSKVCKNPRRRRRRKAHQLKDSHKLLDSNFSSDNSSTSEKGVAVLEGRSTTSYEEEEPIFVIEDVDTANDENTYAGGNRVSQSHSMPVLSINNANVDVSWGTNMTRSIGADFHPFSDTDLSPPPSPGDSRSSTPIKSDTEFEVVRHKENIGSKSFGPDNSRWSWTWGELPTPPANKNPDFKSKWDEARLKNRGGGNLDDRSKVHASNVSGEQLKQKEQQDAAARQSVLDSMLSFMRATKKVRHNPESEGIYLDELNLDDLDPEVAALYFPRQRSSAVSSNPAYKDGSDVGFRPLSNDEDVESGNGTSLPQSPQSFLGTQMGSSDYEESPRHPIFDYRGYQDLAFSLCGNVHELEDGNFPESLFLQSLVTYDDFCENTDITDNPDLVVRLDGKYMSWNMAAPQILSLVLFQRSLPQPVIDKLAQEGESKKEMRKRTESRTYRWFSWGSKKEDSTDQSASNSGGKPLDDVNGAAENSLPALRKQTSAIDIGNDTALSSDEKFTSEKELSSLSFADMRRARLESGRRHTVSCGSDDFGESNIANSGKYKKTLRLSSDQIAKLRLKSGMNQVVFSVTTAYQGTTKCECSLFLWNYDEKIIVSDIDGTITKSDVWGHILPIIGKDWAQGGVAQLYTKIKNNGYKFLYLTARAIGQAHVTREYLRSIKQGDVSLPDGPLLLNPTSLLQAFHREVIIKKPEEFKISCLKDIQALFPKERNPFYAGYGNRVNDVWAYRAVGIPISRIFTINHRGELRHELTQAFQTTYPHLCDIANHMFPPSPASEDNGEFSSLHFWRAPVPNLDKEIADALIMQK